jgi:hypothetical protein
VLRVLSSSILLGLKSYLLQICHDMLSCLGHIDSRLGSSLYMDGTIAFTIILSDIQSQNLGISSLYYKGLLL